MTIVNCGKYVCDTTPIDTAARIQEPLFTQVEGYARWCSVLKHKDPVILSEIM